MLIDSTYEGSLSEVTNTTAKLDNSQQFSALWLSDTNNDPFLLSTLAIESSSRLQIGTNIAVAFARSPFVLAQTAWNLANLAKGRFTLGLGPQIKPHIEKRFSMSWPQNPVAAMEEYIALVRHLFCCFAEAKVPSFKGSYYSCTLGSPVFSPTPHDFGPPEIGIAAVGKGMTELAARACELVFLHPFTHLDYLHKVTLPALKNGSSKRLDGLKPLTRVGSVFIMPTDIANASKYEALVLQRVAFYASTPNYSAVLEALDLGALHETLHQLSRQGRWQDMGKALPDKLLEAVIVQAPLAEIKDAVTKRYQGIYDRAIIDPTPWL